MLSFDYMLRNHKPILIDGSTKTSGTFSRDLFEWREYNQVDQKKLNAEITSNERFLFLLEGENARTTPELTAELKGYKKHIDEKLDFLKKNGSPPIYYKGVRRNRKTIKKGEERLDRTKSSLQELQEQAFLIPKLSKSRELKIEHPSYHSLVEIVRLIENSLDLENDPSNKGEYKKTTHASDTDIRMVATVIWESSHSNNNPALCSSDKDFQRLLGTTPRILCSKTFNPYNEEFTERFLKKPYTFYRINHKRGGVHDNSMKSLINAQKENTPSEEKKQELEQKLGALWIKYAENQ